MSVVDVRGSVSPAGGDVVGSRGRDFIGWGDPDEALKPLKTYPGTAPDTPRLDKDFTRRFTLVTSSQDFCTLTLSELPDGMSDPDYFHPTPFVLIVANERNGMEQLIPLSVEMLEWLHGITGEAVLDARRTGSGESGEPVETAATEAARG